MSSNNGIYVLRTVRYIKRLTAVHWQSGDPYYVWRVAYAMAIDNFYWYKETEPNKLDAYMKDIWGKSPVFDKEEDALLYAHKEVKKYDPLEHGVSSIDTDLMFPDDA